jgi:starch synthase (maltosyl-transferring)
MQVEKNKSRVVIENVKPEIDCGRFPIKRIIGGKVHVEADVFTDGHEAVSCVLMYRKEGAGDWVEVPLTPLVNDRWAAEFTVTGMGRYVYTIQAWLDHFKFWSRSLVKRVEADQDVTVDLLIGANLMEPAIARASGADAERLRLYLEALRSGGNQGVQAALSNELAGLMYRYSERDSSTTYSKELGIVVDRERARFSSWYEFFPRSCWGEPCEHGTFKDCEARLEYVASLGFDVIYLPPIHPIGRVNRKGKNNNVVSQPGEVGSPWAIGAEEGGHKAIHPDLGTLEDFRHFLARAAEYGIEIAMDIAFQCAPDHPYVREHPEWFRMRPDGTIQYAENPPKKYEDIYPFDFETPHWQEMWDELKSVVEYWIEQGVKIFRVDNPHTKSLSFWEWLINGVKREHPETIFLAEAFTRPKVMYYLAKSGFTQSYNYFAWRNTRHELTEYFTELTRTEVKEFFYPNVWPNTPDILTEHLQVGGRPAFMSRVVLAATLAASYGIYGPAYELGENVPMAHGKEEYLNSEKYEIKHWDVNRPDSLKELIARLNRIRRENPALHSNEGLRFHTTSNEMLIAYSKATEDLGNVILTIVNIDPNYIQSGAVELPLEELALDPHQPYQVHDLLTGGRFIWSGRHNYVEINPHAIPAHVFSLRYRMRTEQDFDYYT